MATREFDVEVIYDGQQARFYVALPEEYSEDDVEKDFLQNADVYVTDRGPTS